MMSLHNIQKAVVESYGIYNEWRKIRKFETHRILCRQEGQRQTESIIPNEVVYIDGIIRKGWRNITYSYKG